MDQNSSQQIIGCFAERVICVLGVVLYRIIANASFVDDSQPRIDARAMSCKNLASNGCRIDDIRSLAYASEGRLIAFGCWREALARDHNEASSGGKACQS